MKITRRKFSQVLAGGMALAAAPLAWGQAAWPNKPVRVIVPYTPGGFTDVMARMVSQKLSDRLGQSFIIENKPGAGSLIGVEAAAKSAPDGYTFCVVIAAYASNMTLYEKLPYSPRDLQPVSLIGVAPLVAAVNKDRPYKTAQQLIAYARANPRKISYGSSGNGSAVHLTSELMKMLTKTDMEHIPYKGAAPALADLLGGHIDLFMDSASGLIQPIKTGIVQPIGVASRERLPSLPDVPTFIEQGIAGMEGSTWAGMLAPAGTPAPIIKRVADELSEIVKLPDVRSRLDTLGVTPHGSTPAEFQTFIDHEIKKWGQVIKAAGIKA